MGKACVSVSIYITIYCESMYLVNCTYCVRIITSFSNNVNQLSLSLGFELFVLKWWQWQVYASLHHESMEQCATPAAVIVTAGEVSQVFLWLWNLYFSRSNVWTLRLYWCATWWYGFCYYMTKKVNTYTNISIKGKARQRWYLMLWSDHLIKNFTGQTLLLCTAMMDWINITKGTTDPRVEFISQVPHKSWSNFNLNLD